MLGTQGALHSADMLTTAYSLSHGGQAREGNPLLAPFSKHPMALAAVSTSINALQIYTIAKVNVHHPKLARTWALILIGAESFAVVNNLKMAGRISKQLP